MAPRRESGLLHPLPLLAIAVLLVNDHVLKHRYPGWITGKLSDVAGMVFFPLFLRAAVEEVADLLQPSRTLSVGTRDRLLVACAVATALVFAAVKTWAPATAAYEVGLGLLQWPFVAALDALNGRPPSGVRRVVLTRDVTDLLAIPFVLLALRVGISSRRDP